MMGMKSTTEYTGEFFGDIIKMTSVTKTKGSRASGPGASLRSSSDSDTTVTELSAIARPASSGRKVMPKAG